MNEQIVAENSDAKINSRGTNRRVLKSIEGGLDAQDVFDIITKNTYPYARLQNVSHPNYVINRAAFVRALCATIYLTAGRISEVTGGPIYEGIKQWDADKGKMVLKPLVDSDTGKMQVRRIIGQHHGILLENIEETETTIAIHKMEVSKRSPIVIKKYGEHIAQRPIIWLPKVRGLYDNVQRDKLVPFTWLLLEHLQILKKRGVTSGKVFNISPVTAWRTCNIVTGYWPHFYRAMGEFLRLNYIHKDSMEARQDVADWVMVMNPAQIRSYAKKGVEEVPKHLRRDEFAWIEPAVVAIQQRMLNAGKM